MTYSIQDPDLEDRIEQMKRVVFRSEIAYNIKLERKDTISEHDIETIGGQINLYLNQVSIHEGYSYSCRGNP